MIDRNHDLPVVRQCQILALARSTAYYTPKPTSAEDLALMRRMDECEKTGSDSHGTTISPRATR